MTIWYMWQNKWNHNKFIFVQKKTKNLSTLQKWYQKNAPTVRMDV